MFNEKDLKDLADQAAGKPGSFDKIDDQITANM